MRKNLLMLSLLTLLMGACAAPVPPGAALSTATPSVAAIATAVPSTPVVLSTPVVVTGVTIVPATPQATPQATSTPSATPSSAGASGVQADLKYRLFDTYPNFFFCDPDFYPIARGDEQQMALTRFPEIQRDAESYQVILKHLKLDGVANLSDAQKLTVYRDYKKLNALRLEPAGDGNKFQLRLGDMSGNKPNGTAVEGTISKQGVIVVTKTEPTITTCPICLAANTLIDTPQGQVAVQDLQVGMWVWTRDSAGARVAAPIVRTARVPVPATHEFVHLRLSDGRELFASPGHPTGDGRALGWLRVGDMLDGAVVSSVERVTYADGATYDLLPAGETGTYWANRILIASTLQ